MDAASAGKGTNPLEAQGCIQDAYLKEESHDSYSPLADGCP